MPTVPAQPAPPMEAGASARPRRIGLFGGSFDPPHRAHLALARAALQALALDELRWIPAGQPWQKAHALSAAAHREAMVELLMGEDPRFLLERCELLRPGPSYMIDTVQALQTQAAGEAGSMPAEWFLIIGADQFERLHTWHRWQELLQRVRLAVAPRPGSALDAATPLQGVVPSIVPLPPMDDSATEIRRRAAAGQPIAHLVGAPVARYIAQHALYQGRTGS